MFACASGVTRLLPNSTTLLVAVARAHNVRIEVSLRAVPCNGSTVPTVQTAAEAAEAAATAAAAVAAAASHKTPNWRVDLVACACALAGAVAWAQLKARRGGGGGCATPVGGEEATRIAIGSGIGTGSGSGGLRALEAELLVRKGAEGSTSGYGAS